MLLRWQCSSEANEEDGGHPAKRRCGGCGRRDPLVGLLAAAALVQLCALAAGGAWLHWRLRALEAASHERLCEPCAAGRRDSEQRPTGRDGGGGGGDARKFRPEAATAAASAAAAAASTEDNAIGGVDQTDEESERPSPSRLGARSFPWKRSAAAAAAAAEPAALTDSEPGIAPPPPPLADDETNRSAVAHFVFRGPGEDEFVVDAELSRQEGYRVMVPRVRDGGIQHDRWYPRMSWYRSGVGKLMHLTMASWLDGGGVAGGGAPTLAKASALGVITVLEDGVYLIYAQVCFVDAASPVGFVIKRTTFAGRAAAGYVASCEAPAAPSHSESSGVGGGALRLATCPVTSVHRLARSDRLTIEFTVNRRIFVRSDYTFVGLVRVE